MGQGGRVCAVHGWRQETVAARERLGGGHRRRSVCVCELRLLGKCRPVALAGVPLMDVAIPAPFGSTLFGVIEEEVRSV